MRALFGGFGRDGRPAPVPAPAAHVPGWHSGSVFLQQGESPCLSIGSCTLIATSRLDNRDELIRRLDLHAADAPSDDRLIVHAYEKWGLDCGKYLQGDWAFVLWDAAEQRLVLGRDFLGARSLYYHLSPAQFLCASRLPDVAAHPDVPKTLNPVAVAQLSTEGKRGPETFYQGVLALPPAHVMAVTATTCVSRRYWSPAQIPAIRFRRHDEYLDAFRSIYREAVHQRVADAAKVGIMLSSGLDSTSVAAFAAPELRRQERRLTAFTWVPNREVVSRFRGRSLPDEEDGAGRVAAFVGDIDRVVVASQQGPLAAFRRQLEIVGQPCYTGGGAYWILPVLEEARQRGVRTMLTGDLGNYTVSWQGPASWRARLTRVIGSVRQFGALPRSKVASPYRSVIRAQAAREVLLQTAVHDADIEAQRRRSAQPHQSFYNMSRSGSVSLSTERASAFGMEIRSPTIDQRVVEFCLGVPPDLFARQGRTRLLIRDAMVGLLPSDTLEHSYRGRLVSDLGAWVAYEREDIESTLQQFERSSLISHWLDLPAMRRGFTRVLKQPADIQHREFAALYRGLLVGVALQRFDRG